MKAVFYFNRHAISNRQLTSFLNALANYLDRQFLWKHFFQCPIFLFSSFYSWLAISVIKDVTSYMKLDISVTFLSSNFFSTYLFFSFPCIKSNRESYLASIQCFITLCFCSVPITWIPEKILLLNFNLTTWLDCHGQIFIYMSKNCLFNNHEHT